MPQGGTGRHSPDASGAEGAPRSGRCPDGPTLPTPWILNRHPCGASDLSRGAPVSQWKLGLIGFGGPGGQIALMHEEVVRQKRWIGEERFLHALSVCHLLPGPEAQQLSISPRLAPAWHPRRGLWRDALRSALRTAVVDSELGLCDSRSVALDPFGFSRTPSRRTHDPALRGPAHRETVLTSPLGGGLVLAGALLMPLRIPFPRPAARRGPGGVAVSKGSSRAGSSRRRPGFWGLESLHRERSAVRSLGLLLLGLVLWWGARGAVGTVARMESRPRRTGSLLWEGGDAHVRRRLCHPAARFPASGRTLHWLTASQMLDGLGLAETTPGPLIMVLQFVGFLGAWRDPEPGSPLLAGTLGPPSQPGPPLSRASFGFFWERPAWSGSAAGPRWPPRSGRSRPRCLGPCCSFRDPWTGYPDSAGPTRPSRWDSPERARLAGPALRGNGVCPCWCSPRPPRAFSVTFSGAGAGSQRDLV